jgi:hypothetical protein
MENGEWTDGDLTFAAGPDGLPVDSDGNKVEGSELDEACCKPATGDYFMLYCDEQSRLKRGERKVACPGCGQRRWRGEIRSQGPGCTCGVCYSCVEKKGGSP